jgi:hypothetical protein
MMQLAIKAIVAYLIGWAIIIFIIGAVVGHFLF